MNILIVDDTKLSRMTIKKRLPPAIKENATIREGSNGTEAVRLYKEQKADIVFLDLTMPEMDGFEALAHIREFDRDARVYVVTADIQAKSKEKVINLGATGIEAKPISAERLAEIFSALSGG
ncbi:MAG: response regulator [Thermodesulfobacteriota bacterium]